MRSAMLAFGLLCTLGASPAVAGPMTFASGAGVGWTSDNDAVCNGAAPCSGVTTTVTPHAAWQGNNPDGSAAVWASYKDSGITGTLAPFNQPGNGWLMTVTHTLNTSIGTPISFKIWADDTARVYLNGVEKQGPSFGQATCADKPIGCEPHEFWSAAGWVGTGNDVIRIDVFQVGTGTTAASNPFGVLYHGSYTSVPDAGATVALLGSALIGIGVLRRRIRE
jgi:hypothetical protein